MTGSAKTMAALVLAGAALGAAAARAAPAEPAARLAEPAAAPGTLDAQMSALAASAPPVAAPAPADAAASAPVARRVVEAAEAFQGYTRRAAALSAHFESGGGVAKALSVGAGYEPGQLAAGAAAYGMLAALQDFAFVDAVRAAAPDPAARAALLARLQADPSAVLDVPGADAAAVRVAQVVGRRGADLASAGEAVRQAAYGVQREAWSKAPVDHAPERLQAVKALGAAPATLAAADQEELMTGLLALRTSPAFRAAPGARPTPVVARALAAAAVTALGQGGEEHGEAMMRLLSDARGLDCLRMAKLNLYQCLAVAGPHYEDMFCLGRHAMAETGQCLTSAAGWSGPLEAAPVLARAATPPPAGAPGSVSVPVAVAAVDGPERAGAFAAPASLQMARADIPRFDDVPRAEAPAADAPDEAPPPPRAYARARRAADDDGLDPRPAYAPPRAEAYDEGGPSRRDPYDGAPAARADPRAWLPAGYAPYASLGDGR